MVGNIPEGYKETEIGIIPEDWEFIAIGELFKFKNGLNKAKEYFGYGTPIVNYNDVYLKRELKVMDILGKVFLTSKEIKLFEVKKGDVFFTRTSETPEEVGISTVVVEDVKDTVFSGFVLRARSQNDILDLFYKKYCFSTKAVRNEIISSCTYTTRALTNGTQLSKIKIPLPQLPEQQAIATALCDIDGLISSLTKFINKNKKIKQGAMQELLTGKKRLNGFSGEWINVKLDELCEIKDGTHQTPKYVDSGIPFYSVESISQNEFKNTKFISEEEHAVLTKSYKIEKGDILMTRIGSIGKCKYINWDANASFYVSLALLKVKKEFCAEFICQYSETEYFKQEIELNSLQSAIPKKINLGQISNVGLLIPPTIEEQAAIAKILSDIDIEIEKLNEKLNKYKDIKQGMMQELLTGKRRLI